jgi:hypothetical protein
MSDWNLELPNVKAKRRGVVEQKPVVPAKRKKKATRSITVEYFVKWTQEPSWRPWGKFITREAAERYIDKQVQQRRAAMTLRHTYKHTEKEIQQAMLDERERYRIIDPAADVLKKLLKK